mmetsp:Transcript_15585/g.31622  ORF Transcript_15585/g.31622 Transcript_15585/m.31622 type:complete len:416 (-) Transcript_15585:13-1260(-)
MLLGTHEGGGIQQQLLGPKPSFEVLELLRSLVVESDHGIICEGLGGCLKIPSLEDLLEVVKSLGSGVGLRIAPIDDGAQPRYLVVLIEGVDLCAWAAEVRDTLRLRVSPGYEHHAGVLVHFPRHDVVLELGTAKLLCVQKEVLGACAAVEDPLLSGAHVVEAHDGVLREGLCGRLQVPSFLGLLEVVECCQGSIGAGYAPIDQCVQPRDLVVAVEHVHLGARTAEVRERLRVVPSDIHHSGSLVHLADLDGVVQLRAPEPCGVLQQLDGARLADEELLLPGALVVEADDDVVGEGLRGLLRVPHLERLLEVVEGELRGARALGRGRGREGDHEQRHRREQSDRQSSDCKEPRLCHRPLHARLGLLQLQVELRKDAILRLGRPPVCVVAGECITYEEVIGLFPAATSPLLLQALRE